MKHLPDQRVYIILFIMIISSPVNETPGMILRLKSMRLESQITYLLISDKIRLIPNE